MAEVDPRRFGTESRNMLQNGARRASGAKTALEMESWRTESGLLSTSLKSGGPLVAFTLCPHSRSEKANETDLSARRDFFL